MDIKVFNYSLLLLAIGAYFIPVDNRKKDYDTKDIPLVVFEEPLMYTLNDKNLSRIVDASHAIRYKTRDEMYDADILLQNDLKKNDYKKT
jgi:hypothetical protein